MISRSRFIMRVSLASTSANSPRREKTDHSAQSHGCTEGQLQQTWILERNLRMSPQPEAEKTMDERGQIAHSFFHPLGLDHHNDGHQSRYEDAREQDEQQHARPEKSPHGTH